MKIKNILEITKKELKSYYDAPGGYLLSIIFLALTYFLFLKPFFLSQVVSLRDMFQWMPWMFIVFVPAITMGSFAKEFENQTIEYLLSKPVSRKELIIGKILGAFGFVYSTVLFTVPAIYFISRIGNLDISETIIGYIGVMFLALTMCAVGVGLSSLFKNQISAFVFSVVFMFFLVIIGSELTSINLPVRIAEYLSLLSITDHFNSLTRGILKASDLAYFLIMIVSSIGLAEYSLNREKGINAAKIKNNQHVFIWVIAAILTIFITSKYMYGRIDLTSTKKYTLSEPTKSVLKADGKVTLEVYASNNLPPQFKAVYEELKNTLDDYKTQGGQNLDIQFISPEGKGTELQQKNITPVEFRVYGNDQLQAQKGYLAIYIRNEGGQSEIIPIVQDINNLEYDLTRLIYRLKTTEKTKIAFAGGNGERDGFNEYSNLKQLLENDYQIESIFLPSTEQTTDKKDQIIPDLSSYKILLLANPTADYTNEAKNKIKEYAEKGGSIIYLAEGVNVDPNTAAASSSKPESGSLLADLGAKVNNDLLYDIQNHGMISIQTVQGVLPINYPFFVYAQRNDSDIGIKDLPENLLMGWSSSLNLDENWKVLYQTSPFGGLQNAPFNINPDQQYPQNNLKQYPLIAYRQLDNGGKVFVLSTARIFDNQFLAGVEQNAVFALRIFEEAYRGIGLSNIKARNVVNNQILYVSPSDKNLVNYGIPVSSILLLSALGYARYRRRRNLAKYYRS